MSDDCSSCGSDYSSNDSGCSVPDMVPCGPTEQAIFDDLLIYGMTAQKVTADSETGIITKERVDPEVLFEQSTRVPYLPMNVDIPNRGETRYESDRRAESYLDSVKINKVEHIPNEACDDLQDPMAGCPDEEWRLMPWVYYGLGIVTGGLLEWVFML
jgi:hypothetical protein